MSMSMSILVNKYSNIEYKIKKHEYWVLSIFLIFLWVLSIFVVVSMSNMSIAYIITVYSNTYESYEVMSILIFFMKSNFFKYFNVYSWYIIFMSIWNL